MKLKILLIVGLACCVFGCTSTPPAKPIESIDTQIATGLNDFFSELETRATPRSYYTLFIPENTANIRHLQNFRAAMDKTLRQTSTRYLLHYNTSSERIFFLNKHNIPDFEVPDKTEGEVLAKEFRNGTDAGWTAINAFWQQFNRLMIGDAHWLAKLPESVRADLTQPLKYILRVTVFLTDQPSITRYRHSIQFEWIVVGKEETIFAKSYPLVLSYPLQ